MRRLGRVAGAKGRVYAQSRGRGAISVNHFRAAFVQPVEKGEVGRPLAIREEIGLEDTLVVEHRARIVRLCRLLLPDRDEAEDAAQETMMKLVREIRAGNVPRKAASWLATVAIHTCRDRRRSRWWRWWLGSAEEMPEVAGAAPTPEDTVLARAGERRILAAFRALSARQREVFLLRHLEGLSTAETAEALDLDGGTVKRHLFRAVAKLRAELGESA